MCVCVCVCVCVFVCVCVCGEREKGRERQRDRDRDRQYIYVSPSLPGCLSAALYVWNGLLVSGERERRKKKYFDLYLLGFLRCVVPQSPRPAQCSIGTEFSTRRLKSSFASSIKTGQERNCRLSKGMGNGVGGDISFFNAQSAGGGGGGERERKKS